MRCGGGIKNKLLEAAAMACPIVASPAAIAGLDFGSEPAPLLLCRSPKQWQEAVLRLWDDAVLAADFGQRARQWVEQQHTWSAAARSLADWLDVHPSADRASIIQRLALAQGRADTRQAA
jgi:glycosyltransferase involved in cell wall biosynthesis